ncbi:MAG: phosphoribosylformimino-5-aminoimidazole carboxamide ribotide isomerase [Desulfobacterales bacterium SG8_35_2]|nr:MAG: phosphoribosylformimino-5-aminoimidazole carboxamide ribotide isomerase [Desulfobacterales bacterium SG8_35_2]
MKFRPCIDLHNGKVKQIVGSTLSDASPDALRTNFTSEFPSSYYARMYRRDGLYGGHVIMLGPGNEAAASEAFQAFPQGLQAGGSITPKNARYWLDQGAAAVIVTSYVFKEGQILTERLKEMQALVGRDKLVIDLSCRKKGDDYYVVTDRWQKFTNTVISPETLEYFSRFCFEFLIHAADVEGKCQGIADDLVANLAAWSPLPTTYAGGVRDLRDFLRIQKLGNNRLDVTVGSSLDIFGGTGMKYSDAVAFNRQQGAT